MKCRLLTSTLSALALMGTLHAAHYPDRFVWVFGWSLRNDKEVAEVTNLLATAAQAGLNGAVLSANLDTLCQQSPDYFRRLEQVKQSLRPPRLGPDPQPVFGRLWRRRLGA